VYYLTSTEHDCPLPNVLLTGLHGLVFIISGHSAFLRANDCPGPMQTPQSLLCSSGLIFVDLEVGEMNGKQSHRAESRIILCSRFLFPH